MITLVTGSPGAGKTLWTVKEIVDSLIPTGRSIVTNIDGFNSDDDNVTVFDQEDDLPFRWEEYDDGTIFIFDEVQRQYPPRHPTSKVPDFIKGFETHRHRNMDFYLITQSPKLIDRHLWPLTKEHVHLFRAFGMKRSRIYRWNAVNESPQPAQTKGTALTSNFSFPKRYFTYYKSASEHTDKMTVPWKIVFLMLGLACLAFGGFGYVYFYFFNRGLDPETSISAGPDRASIACGYSILGTHASELLIQTATGFQRVPMDSLELPYFVATDGTLCQWTTQQDFGPIDLES